MKTQRNGAAAIADPKRLRVIARLGWILCLSIYSASHALATEPPAPLPQWLTKAIAAEKKSSRPGVFEEATYAGKRVFEFIAGDRADTGDEHTLFAEDGTEICKFGGLGGHVTSGACNIERIIYKRKL